MVCALALREGVPVRNAGGSMGEELRKAEVRTNDAFEEGFFDEGATVSNLVRIIDSLPAGSTELMCHPAHEDAELAASSSYAAVRVRELAALCDPSVKAAISRAGIRLITFTEL